MLKHSSFFIYVLRDPRQKGRIFYVGKAQTGKESQTLWRHMNVKTNKHKQCIIEAIQLAGFEPELVILRKRLNEQQAFFMERRLIKSLKMLGFKLSNLTDGGEGTSGYKHSEAVCIGRSVRMREKNPMKDAATARKAARHRRKTVVQFKNGRVVGQYPSASEAQRQTGVFQQNITACCRGETVQASGYVWRYSNES